MDNHTDTMELEIAVVIVNYGSGSRVLKTAKHNGVQGGVVFIGTGTVKSHLLEFLELSDTRKEIVMLVADAATICAALNNVDTELHLSKPNHGIAFTIAASDLLVTGKDARRHHANGGEYKYMYQSIVVIVKRGEAELVMDAATGAGARGGTVIKARGAGNYESGRLFHMDIASEKELVLILTKVADADKIIDAIRDKLDADATENGVIICQDVKKVYGLA